MTLQDVGSIGDASELTFQDREDGVSEPRQLERALAGMLPLLRTPGGQAYWKVFATRAGYPDEFRALIDAELAREPRP